MLTIELVGGPHDGRVQEITEDFPEIDVGGYPTATGRLSCIGTYKPSEPMVCTLSGKLKYIWVRPDQKGEQ